MTDFESTLVAALHEEAEEFSMNVDLHQAQSELEVRLDGADRGRRRMTWWSVAAAAAAVVLIGVGIRAFQGTSTPAPIGPQPSSSPTSAPFAVTTTTLTPNLRAALPGWTSTSGFLESEPGIAGWNQVDCGGTPGPCPVGKDLRLRMFSVHQMYRPQDGPRITLNPTYQQYVAHIKALPTAGVLRISSESTLTVGGRPATEFQYAALKQTPGAMSCLSEFDLALDCIAGFSGGRSARMVVVDQGKLPPTVIVLGLNTDNPQKAERFAEFQTSLGTIRFGA